MKLLCPECRKVMENDVGPTYHPPVVEPRGNSADLFACSNHQCDWCGTTQQAVDAAEEMSKLADESLANWVTLARWLDARPGAFKPKPEPDNGVILENVEAQAKPTTNKSHQAFSVKVEPDGNAGVRWFVHNQFGDLIQSGHAVDNHAALAKIFKRLK